MITDAVKLVEGFYALLSYTLSDMVVVYQPTDVKKLVNIEE